MSFLFKSRRSQASHSTSIIPQSSTQYNNSSLIPTPNGEKRQVPNSSTNTVPSNPNTSHTFDSNGNPRARTDSDNIQSRSIAAKYFATTNPSIQLSSPNSSRTESPYPWSQRTLVYGPSLPFPRYGAAVNSNASKSGSLYVMGGLVNGSAVKGDLWIVECGNLNPSLMTSPNHPEKSNSFECNLIQTRSEGPSPRVGHACLLVGNAYIVFGGDTKVEDFDVLDDTLYFLNTDTRQWSRAFPTGPRPPGRYGHSLNIIGSKLYIFGGQVEGLFFNDLFSFDLNQLQSTSNRWETITSNGASIHCNNPIPTPRTNHSMVSWNDKLYLFGGTDGNTWFNDVWSFSPQSNIWTELECIGYIPTPREGHAAALVNDTMYIFGGRVQEGTDLGDLAAFKISSRRWYMFQNMGFSPSPRSGHSMTSFGKSIIVLGGEPSSTPRDSNELSLAYILDTSKIRYPTHDQPSPSTRTTYSLGDRTAHRLALKNLSALNDSDAQTSSTIKGTTNSDMARVRVKQTSTPNPSALNVNLNSGSISSSRLPRATSKTPSQSPPHSRPMVSPGTNTETPAQTGPVIKSLNLLERQIGSPTETSRALDSGNYTNIADIPRSRTCSTNESSSKEGKSKTVHNILSESSSVLHHASSNSVFNPEMCDLAEASKFQSHSDNPASLHSLNNSAPQYSGYTSPPKENELIKSNQKLTALNAWYASELALARRSGYVLTKGFKKSLASNSPQVDTLILDFDTFVPKLDDEDKPLIEALLKMRIELSRIQHNLDNQTSLTSFKIAQIERQRDGALNEAIYTKSKLASLKSSPIESSKPSARNGITTNKSGKNTPGPDLTPRSTFSVEDSELVEDLSRRLAIAIGSQNEAQDRVNQLLAELDCEKRARLLAEQTAEAAQNSATELDSYRQRTAGELEELRASLHEATLQAREQSSRATEAAAREKSARLEADETLSYQRSLHKLSN